MLKFELFLLYRCGQYDAEIRRLDLSRSSPQFDFKQLFLVKESLALMYQMMQLPTEALLQYEELEVLMDSYAPPSLPETNWPLFSTSVSSTNKTHTGDNSTERTSESQPDATTTSYIDKEIRGLWYEPAFQGDAVLTYSINHARMRVLKNKMGILELTHYVFARECFFYFGLGKASLCAEKAMHFLTFAENHLKKRLESGSLLRSTQLDAVAATGEAMKLDSKTLRSMIDIWAVTAVVRVARSCREYSVETTLSKSREGPELDTIGNGTLSSNSNFGELSAAPPSRSANNNTNSTISNGKNKEPKRSLCNLLEYAHVKLLTSLLTRPRTSLLAQRKTAFELATALKQWDDIVRVLDTKPSVLISIPEKILNSNVALKSAKRSNIRQSPLYLGGKGDVEQIEKLDDALSTFSKALRHMMQAAHLMSTMPRPEPTLLGAGSQRSSSPMASLAALGAHGTGNSPLVSQNTGSDAAPEPNLDKPVSSSGDRLVSSGESHKSRHSLSSVATAWFTAETKLPVLEAQVAITFTRLLAEHEGEAGRLRLAFQAKCDCADVLICCGRFDYAKEILLSALAIDNCLLLSSGMAGNTRSTRIGGAAHELVRKAASASKRHAANIDGFSSLSVALGSVTCSAGGISTLNYSTSVGGVWKLFRYVVLRKLLLCARVLNDSRLYLDISFRLLDPLMADLLNNQTATSICYDIISISRASKRIQREDMLIATTASSIDRQNSATVATEGGYLTGVLPAPMFPHVVVSIDFDVYRKVRVKNNAERVTDATSDANALHPGLKENENSNKIRVATMRSVTSVIHDEPFKVSYAECEAGRQHILNLNIESSFPVDVTLDNLVVSYIPFSLVENGQHSPLQKHGGGLSTQAYDSIEANNNIGSDFFRHQSFQSFQFGNGIEDRTEEEEAGQSGNFGSNHFSGQIDTGFECHPYFDTDGTKIHKLVLKPGKQTVPMYFNARAVGEYAPLFISAQIGNTILVERIEADVNKLHNFFERNTLISIIKPPDPIALSVLVPPLCPIGHIDSVLVGIGLEVNDQLHDVEISVHAIMLDKQFIESLKSVEDDVEKDYMITQYIDGAGDSRLFLEDNNLGTTAPTNFESMQQSRMDTLVSESLYAPITGNLTENKVVPSNYGSNDARFLILIFAGSPGHFCASWFIKARCGREGR